MKTFRKTDQYTHIAYFKNSHEIARIEDKLKRCLSQCFDEMEKIDLNRDFEHQMETRLKAQVELTFYRVYDNKDLNSNNN